MRTIEGPRQFGERPRSRPVHDRPGAYAVIRDGKGRVAVVLGRSGYHLPGGGLEAGESDIEALRREGLEEIGYELSVGDRIGEAKQYVQASNGRCYNKLCAYFRAWIRPDVPAAPGAEHAVVWLSPTMALDALDHDSHAWAVRQALDEPC